MRQKPSRAGNVNDLDQAFTPTELKKYYFTVSELRKITGITLRQVRHWKEIDLLVPYIRNPKASGSQPASFYSAKNVLKALIICEMMKRGLSLPQVRKTDAYLRERGLKLEDSTRYLLTNGETAFYAENATRVVDILKHENQMLLIPVWEHLLIIKKELRRAA